MQGEGRGQHLREKLPGVGELLDFFPWDGRRVPCMVLGTVIGTEFVVGHKHLANLSVLHSSFLTSGLQNFPSHS